jgi:hypothetical protein
MSTPLPTQEQAKQAYSYMVDQIHVPAFFEKLAANGLEPRNQVEAQQLLQLGAVLAHAEANGQVKQAQDGNPFLSHVLGELVQPNQPDVDALVKQSADALVANSDLAKTAALVYAHMATGGEVAPDEAPAAE